MLPEQTIHKANTKFLEKEVLKTNHFENYSLNSIQGRCWILFVKDYIRGRPKGSLAEHTFVCESRYNEASKTISKIKNWSLCVPESIKHVVLDLELFDVPLVPSRVPSVLAEQQQQQQSLLQKGENEEKFQKKRLSLVADKKESVKPNVANSMPFMNAPPMPLSQMKPSNSSQQINPAYYNSLTNVPGESIPDKTSVFFEKLPDGKVKWFAGPPLDVVGNEPLDHSLDYLHMRAEEVLNGKSKRSLSPSKGSPKKQKQSSSSSKSKSTPPLAHSVSTQSEKDWLPLTKALEGMISILLNL